VLFRIGLGSLAAQCFHNKVHLNEQPFECILVDALTATRIIRRLIEPAKRIFDIVVQTAALASETFRNLKVACWNGAQTAGSRHRSYLNRSRSHGYESTRITISVGAFIRV